MESTIRIIPGLWEGRAPFAQLETLLSPTYPIAYAHSLQPAKDENEVVIFAHSIGGVLGPVAMEGLSLKERKERGRKGGVIGIFFLAAGIATEGVRIGGMPFYDIQGGSMYCTNPLSSLFNDFPPALAKTWLENLQPQPVEGWDGEIKYCGWRHDQVLTRGMQEGFAELVGSMVVRCEAGYMAMLVLSEVVAGGGGCWGV
ncbi:hypothetical protein B0J14DRAFT_618979 [Halenospora varia]|nr:hypothetical protein B0J14DRAFT_618979 [Halenospora varia]